MIFSLVPYLFLVYLQIVVAGLPPDNDETCGQWSLELQVGRSHHLADGGLSRAIQASQKFMSI